LLDKHITPFVIHNLSLAPWQPHSYRRNLYAAGSDFAFLMMLWQRWPFVAPAQTTSLQMAADF
jgi:hypothetical protein